MAVGTKAGRRHERGEAAEGRAVRRGNSQDHCGVQSVRSPTPVRVPMAMIDSCPISLIRQHTRSLSRARVCVMRMITCRLKSPSARYMEAERASASQKLNEKFDEYEALVQRAKREKAARGFEGVSLSALLVLL